MSSISLITSTQTDKFMWLTSNLNSSVSPPSSFLFFHSPSASFTVHFFLSALNRVLLPLIMFLLQPFSGPQTCRHQLCQQNFFFSLHLLFMWCLLISFTVLFPAVYCFFFVSLVFLFVCFDPSSVSGFS